MNARRLLAVLMPLLVLSACATQTENTESESARPTSASPSAPATSLTPVASEEPSDPTTAWPTVGPEQQVDAGTVTSESSATATGDGDATVTFKRDGNFAMVVDVDCGECRNTEIFAAPSGGPGGATPNPLGKSSGSFLIDVYESTDADRAIWIETPGAWSVEIKSWNTIPTATLPQEGVGSVVMYLDGDTSKVQVTYQPANDEDSFQGRYFGVDDADSLVFGADEPIDEVYELAPPGILSIETEGSWTLTPVS